MQNLLRINHKQESITTASLFLFVMFALSMVSVGNCFNPENKIAAVENRMMAPLPKLKLRSKYLLQFPSAFSAFFNDRFAYRQELVSLINFINYRAFSVSNNPAVVVGHHGWLFFFIAGDQETTRHYPLFTKEELETWGKVLEARQAWLAARNIKFLFVIAPSKCTIYGEELPSTCSPVQRQSRQDQLLKYLELHGKVGFVDLRQPLIDAKKYARIYYHTDTHWNPLGGYIGYRKVAERLAEWFPQIRPLGFADVKMDTFRFADGDLQNMMGVHQLIPETVPRVLPKRAHSWLNCKIKTTGQREVAHAELAPYATEIDDKSLPRAFCLRDSFMASMEPFLSTHFRRISYYWQQEFPDRLVESEKPDVVIEEVVERELCRFDPHNPPAVDQALEQQYVAARKDTIRLAGASASEL
jgi:hypothetical protein